MDSRRRDAKGVGNFQFGMAVGKQQKGGFLPGWQRGQGGVEIQSQEDLRLRLRGQVLADLKLGRTERFVPILDLFEIEVAKMFPLAAQRSIPGRDLDR